MIRVRLFGAVAIHDAQGNDLRAALGQSKRTALLAYLAIARPRGGHRRETLLALFWPELTEERARRALSQSVYYLRKRLGTEAITVRAGDEIGLSQSHISCDVVEFEDLLDAGEEEKALGLYSGPLLAGFHLGDLLEFEHWAESERSRLKGRAARAAWVLADRAAEAGDAHNATAWARRSMELSHDEAALRHLIAMRDRFGDRAGAIREYDRFARQLAIELEADPAPETQELIAQIRMRSGTITPLAPRPALDVDLRGDGDEQFVPPDKPVAQLADDTKRASEQKRRSRRRIAFLLAALPLAAASTWAVDRELKRQNEPEVLANTVAILPFSYTGSIDHADAAEAVVNLLDANIENVGGMRTVDWRSLKGFVDRSTSGPLTLAGAAAAARRFNAERYVVGAVSESGDRIRVTAAIYARHGSDQPETRAIVEGDPGKLFTIVDELSAKLLLGSNPSARLYRSASLTTSSMDALKAYLDGERDFREGRYISALQHFRTAVDADSAFALAWFRLSQSASLTSEDALALNAATEALQPDRGLGRYERQHAEAWRYTLQGRIPEAMALYRELSTADTTDVEAVQYLAYMKFYWGPRSGQPAEQSAPEWRRVLNRDPYNPVALGHLARLHARAGNSEQFAHAAERFARFGPESDRALELRALKGFVFDDTTSRTAVIRDFATANPSVQQRVLASVLTSTTNLAAAAPLVSSYLVRRTGAGDESSSWLRPAVSLARGRVAEALAMTEPQVTDGPTEMLSRGVVLFLNPKSAPATAIRDSRERLAAAARTGRPDARTRMTLRYVSALLDLCLEDTASAVHTAEALATSSDRGGTGPRLAALIRAEAARKEGRASEALALLGDPVPTGNRIPGGFAFPLAHERFLRAELLRETQQPAEALRWYATFPDPAGYDIWYLLLAKRKLMEMHALLGNRPAAQRHRAQLVSLTRDT